MRPVLDGLPILANVDFGHTFLLATLPIGGQIAMNDTPDRPTLTVSDCAG